MQSACGLAAPDTEDEGIVAFAGDDWALALASIAPARANPRKAIQNENRKSGRDRLKRSVLDKNPHNFEFGTRNNSVP
jgi:hypothetical protein